TLAHQLERAVEATLADPVLSPRPGSHLMGSRSLRTFGSDSDAPPMVRIEQAISELWSARDDAHVKAWRDAGMEGPAMTVLTEIWSSDSHTVGALQKALAGEQAPQDIESSLVFLLDKDYIMRDNDHIGLTPAGVLVREDIERE